MTSFYIKLIFSMILDRLFFLSFSASLRYNSHNHKTIGPNPYYTHIYSHLFLYTISLIGMYASAPFSFITSKIGFLKYALSPYTSFISIPLSFVKSINSSNPVPSTYAPVIYPYCRYYPFFCRHCILCFISKKKTFCFRFISYSCILVY